MAVNNKPSFNCATARRAVEKAICANPESRQTSTARSTLSNTKVVREAGSDNPARRPRSCSERRMISSPAAMPRSAGRAHDLQQGR